MKQKIKKWYLWMDGLKKSKKSLKALIILNAFLAIGSNIADWPWLSSIQWYLLPFAPICSLYPLVLCIIFTLMYFGKKVPVWLTSFIFMAIVSYGFMTYIYYPLYMNWDGVTFRLVGNMVWVTIYASQSLILASELKVLPAYQYALIFGYFGFKDYSDRFLGSFIDILRPDFPHYLIDIFTVSMVFLHVTTATLLVALPLFKQRQKARVLSAGLPTTSAEIQDHPFRPCG